MGGRIEFASAHEPNLSIDTGLRGQQAQFVRGALMGTLPALGWLQKAIDEGRLFGVTYKLEERKSSGKQTEEKPAVKEGVKDGANTGSTAADPAVSGGVGGNGG